MKLLPHLVPIVFAMLVFPAAGAEQASPDFHASVTGAVAQANAKLWSEHVGRSGLILDYIGDIPT
ncbi:MAG: hypothetical protein NTY53_03160, partial [Kiritimatiellaeota bacterium]|nr:hypothetical protein [Kiritimatiellota bacterium]